jgi:hypothetical protein
MATVDQEFLWTDPSYGFPWAAGVGDLHASANTGRSIPAMNTRAFAQPRELSGLFLHLAETPADESGVKTFRDKCVEVLHRTPMRTTVAASDLLLVQSGQDWEESARWMRLLVDLWQMAQKRKRADLSQHIRWTEQKSNNKCVTYECRRDDYPEAHLLGDIHEVIASDDLRPEWLEVLKPKDVFAPALAFIETKINSHLGADVSAQLLLDAKSKRLCLEVIPRTFSAFIWLQFGRAVAEGKEYSRCLTCGTYFEQSTTTARTNRRFCSNACRSKNYRERQEEARRLHTAGWSLSEIVCKLDSDRVTVQGWLAPKHRKEARRLHADGWSIHEIVRFLDIDKATVQAWLAPRTRK